MVTHRWRELGAVSNTSMGRPAWGQRFLLGERKFEPVQMAVRVIITAWLYESASRVLFTSDFFAHLVCPSRELPPVVTGSEPVPRGAEVSEHLRTKCEWPADANTEPIRQRLEMTFIGREAEAIAPGHGCAIGGTETVRRHV